MKVLFIGGTGIISSACSALAAARGMELYLLNRGHTTRKTPPSAHLVPADIRDPQSVTNALQGRTFDVVVDWVAYTPEHIETDLALFRGRTRQYVFISSASAYHKPPPHLPITESTPLHNPFWGYSRAKIACEERLMAAYRQEGFPVTIVRPSHTYDQTLLPMHGGYSVVDRMRRGLPVLVHGDGTSLWTLTHHADFARGFVGLLGHPQAIGDVFHITSDELLTWNQIFQVVAAAAGVTPQLVHVPAKFIAAFDPEWGASLLGDKSHSMIFDNSKIRRLVPDFRATIPFWQGAREIMAWYDADPRRQIVNDSFEQLQDRIISAYRSAWPASI
ncbi:MAG: SDR family oxidoreductase [Anaerolineales bacterium]|nr:SDR family oxidoreductase [Anaerolineales bacterium]MCB8950778.1 SDR family oxidoreductase [Ardenticatenales bacterium]